MKLISDAYLYSKSECNKTIFKYLVSAERVDKNPDLFSDIIYAVKKQVNSIILKVLLSDKVVLMIDDVNGGMSRAFKVIYAKDMKDYKKHKKVFIDCTGIITKENGMYYCNKLSTLISYLYAAMTYIVYYNNPKSIISNYVIMRNGAEMFTDLALYVLSYLKVPITYNDNKERMSFALSEYFLYCVAGTKDKNTIYNISKQVSRIESKNTCDYLHTLFGFTLDDGNATFNDFIIKFAEVFLDQVEGAVLHGNKNKLTVEAFAHRWMYAYGAGTFLGLECFVPFSQIISDCYNGAYINQQNTIEKIAGSKQITAFSNELLKIGEENA